MKKRRITNKASIPGNHKQFPGVIEIRNQEAISLRNAQADIVLNELSVGQQVGGEVFKVDLTQANCFNDAVFHPFSARITWSEIVDPPGLKEE